MSWTSLTLILAILAAATSPNLSRSVKLYLYSQAVAIPVTEMALWLVGWQSPYYTAVYVLASLAGRITSWWIVQSVGSHWLERVVSLAFASIVSVVAYRHLDGVSGLTVEVLLPEGALLVFLGMVLGFQAPFHKERQVLVPLSVMWLVLGVFDFGILMHRWPVITDMGSYAIAITAFSWIACNQRGIFLNHGVQKNSSV